MRFAVIDMFDCICFESYSDLMCYEFYYMFGSDMCFRGIYDYTENTYLDIISLQERYKNENM